MNKILLFTFCLGSLIIASCAERFLDEKSDKSLVIFTKLTEFESLMDRVSVMNQMTSQELAILSLDDYYLLPTDWQLLASSIQRNAYVWNSEIFEGEWSRDWNNGYERIFYANIALEGLAKMTPTEKEEKLWGEVKGRALFHRAWNHYSIMLLFGEYTGSLEIDGTGIPLRRESDINIPVARSTLKDTYQFILSDLQESLRVIGDDVYNPERPSKCAVLMLLSKIYLYQQDYVKAWEYAQQALAVNNKLIDFNTVDVTPVQVFPIYGAGNPEIVFNAWLPALPALAQTRACMDESLYELYDDNDLRKQAYFMRNPQNEMLNFKGSYVGYALPFSGLSINELYLIAMEAACRIGRQEESLNLYNKLRSHRFSAESYTPVQNVGREELLTMILEEKRRELVMRASRWEDLKRLNGSGEWSYELSRDINGQRYVLPPNDKRYIFPIPQYVIDKSNIEQNPR